MPRLMPGTAFPPITLPRLGGGTITLGQPEDGHAWQVVVVYRGLHCPKCKTYLQTLETLLPRFHGDGVHVVAISGDPEAKARAFVEETGLTLPVGHDLSLAQMDELGLFISDPRTPPDAEAPFAEPGLFIINEQGQLHALDISNGPFLRPDLAAVADGIAFIREKGFEIRGRKTLT